MSNSNIQHPTSDMQPGHADPPAAHALWTHLAEALLRIEALEAKVDRLEEAAD